MARSDQSATWRYVEVSSPNLVSCFQKGLLNPYIYSAFPWVDSPSPDPSNHTHSQEFCFSLLKPATWGEEMGVGDQLYIYIKAKIRIVGK